MSIAVPTPDGEMKELELNVFTAQSFLVAVQQSGLETYKNEVAQMRELLSDSPTKTLMEAYTRFGDAVESLYFELFEKREGDKLPLLEAFLRYNYGPGLKVTQEFVGLYVKSYKRYMLLAAKGQVLSDLLKKRLGEKAYKKNNEFKKIEEKAARLRNNLDWIMLGFGGG